MANDEAISAPPMQSPPPSSFSFPRKSSYSDGVSAEEPSHVVETSIDSDILSEDGTQGAGTAMLTDKSILSIPPSLKDRTQMDSVLEWVQDVQQPGDSRLDLRSLGVGACCAESNQHQRITNLHSPSLPSLADCHQRTMSSHELTHVSSATSSSRQPSIFSYNVDDESELDETSSNDTVTLQSPCLEHLTSMGSGLDRTQNMQHQAFLMSKMVSESHPISICFQLLRTAIDHIQELQQALGLIPMELPERYITQTVPGSKEYIAPSEHKITGYFLLDIDIICVLPKGFADRFRTKAPSIRHMIFDEGGLLETMRKLRIYCQDSEHAQSLPATLRYAAATMYVEFFDCCNEVVSPRNWRYQN
ncbi:hypothetical protein FANTH_1924 [Fusarium anthophilum]|uniref:Uncharacterized protein n=1 Tax=Fusarium anthophilum TaxID=48485 RepID=A0A8H4ZW88_9HYPO|nr:hypothetical protein FANTH_1924 [Fusarium anthophilum]